MRGNLPLERLLGDERPRAQTRPSAPTVSRTLPGPGPRSVLA